MSGSKYNISVFFGRIYSFLPSGWRYGVLIMFLLMLLSAGVETVSVGMLALFVTALSNPEVALTSKYVSALNGITGDVINSGRLLVYVLAGFVVGLVLLKNALRAGSAYLFSWFTAWTEAFFGKLLLQGFIGMPYEWHLRKNSADLVLSMEWRRFFGSCFLLPILQVLNDAILVLLMLAALVFVQPVLSLSFLGLFGLIGGLFYLAFRRHLDSLSTGVRNYNQHCNRHITKTIHGMKDVLMSGKERHFVVEYERLANLMTHSLRKRQFVSSLPVSILESFGFVILVAAICVMLFQESETSYTQAAGGVVLLGAAGWRILPAVVRIVGGANSIRHYAPYIGQAFDYFDEFEKKARPLSLQDKDDDVGLAPFSSYEMKNVSFTYQGAENCSLDRLNFVFKKGQSVGVIGKSGAGKSTFVDAFIGLLSCASGQILLNGEPLTDEKKTYWMQQIGYVTQFPYICDGSLADNVAFGCPQENMDLDLVRQCCDSAAIDFWDSLPDGIHSPLGERGVLLSGGQRQRVAIARALYARPSVLVFDEATSSLDDENEKAIQRTIVGLKGSVSMLIVSHRLTTVRDCDVVVWLQDGRVVEQGPPDVILPKYMSENDTQ